MSRDVRRNALLLAASLVCNSGMSNGDIGVANATGWVQIGDAANDEDADDDPRSFKNQSVGERMLIISAGVVMNILLGCGLFVWVYMHGLEEKPAGYG